MSISTDPKTIEELKQWYIDHNLPDETITRFFIGKDYKYAKAFGIYKDITTGEFIVYKNKADGTRAVRYQGTDEQYAVNELFSKLKDEIWNQKYNNNSSVSSNFAGYKRKFGSTSLIEIIVLGIMICIMFLIFIIPLTQPKRGYYYYDDDYYYYQEGTWYEYEDYGGWRKAVVSEDLKKNHSDYYTSYNYTYGIDSFQNSPYYREPSSSSSSDDYSWSSSDSWDSSSTDWDSDW